jgi:nitroreductase
MMLLLKLKRRASLLRHRLKVFPQYVYDIRRFLSHSQAWITNYDEMHLKGQLLRKVHSLEKGFSMPPPRRVFGEKNISTIKQLLSQLEDTEASRWMRDYATQVIAEVEIFNRSSEEERNAFPRSVSQLPTAITAFDKAATLRSLPPAPEDFFATRRSVRIYEQIPVDQDLLRRAASLAQLAPSVCNRQSGRVRFYSGEAEKTAILALQDGNKGFGHQVPTVAVISSDLRSFHGGHERNQGYVDGGLFAMSLTFALHALGLGSCMMNWCVFPKTDRDLRKLINLPDHEIVITLMSVGHLPESYHVARSRRRPLDEVLLELS